MVLVWRRLSFASYIGWRDWVQLSIRLLVTYSPATGAVWQKSVSVDPPAWLCTAPQWLAFLGLAPLVLNAMLIPEMLAVGFAHPLPLWPHALLQCCIAVAVAGDLDGGCASRFVSHPASRHVVDQFVWLFHLLSFKGFFGAGTSLNRGFAWECRHCVLMLQLLVGLLGSLAAQAASDAAAIPAFNRWQQRQRGQVASMQHSTPSLFDSAYDALSKIFLVRVSTAARRPAVWLLVAVLLWNALVLFMP